MGDPQSVPETRVEPERANELIWIGYTTRYREGGREFERAAKTLAAEKVSEFGADHVRCSPVESKDEFRREMATLRAMGHEILELHLVAHAGMYGPMFGTRSWPEQFSPHEWREMAIPFASAGEAYFRTCRSARWFAPFFARTFRVPTHGYHWYTTFSRSKSRFVAPLGNRAAPLHCIGCPGRTSHGWFASIRKYVGMTKAEPLRRFESEPPSGDPSYDGIAELYDRTFDDIRVRRDEWDFLRTHLPDRTDITVIDIGCGNGALLSELEPRIARGVGVDASPKMIEIAKLRNRSLGKLEFETVRKPKLPFPDCSFDVAISLLSFRYLDWDPIMEELARVLKPDGNFLIVDMMAAPLRFRDLPRYAYDKLRIVRRAGDEGHFRAALERMVADARWQDMLKFNPIRAEHEYRWYLESRFPGRKVQVLNIGANARVMGFDSGPMYRAQLRRQAYP